MDQVKFKNVFTRLPGSNVPTGGKCIPSGGGFPRFQDLACLLPELFLPQDCTETVNLYDGNREWRYRNSSKNLLHIEKKWN